MHRIIIVFLLLVSYQYGIAQNGADFKFGPVLLQTESAKFTKSSQYHNGWQIGIKARFGRDRFYFNPGFFYRTVQLSSSPNINPFQAKEKMTLLNFPVDMGIRIIRSQTFSMRLFSGVSLNYIQSIEENNLGLNLDSVNDVHFNGDIGIGFDIYWLTIDAVFEKGLLNIFKDDKPSKGDYFNVSLGFFF